MNAAVVVAHPDDETLWCGGLMLQNPAWNWLVVTLCRASDRDRAPRFHRAMTQLTAKGAMGDLDDGPAQASLRVEEVEQAILERLPARRFDLLLTHGPRGEYTRHVRHEECCRAVVKLWSEERIQSDELWMFAYEDGGGQYLPRAEPTAAMLLELPEPVWRRKQELITDAYGFSHDSWEAQVTPRVEGFVCFQEPVAAARHVADAETPR